MALKLTDKAPSRPVMGMIYGRGGSRKTSLANTAKNPLVIAFDQRGYGRSFRQSDHKVYVNSWSDIADIDAKDVAPFDTLVIDTVGRALHAASEKVISDSEKNSIPSTGALSKQGYGAIKKLFYDWLFRFADNIDVIFIAQDKTMPNPEDAEADMAIPDIVGGTRSLIYSECDFIGWARATEGDKFFISFNPSFKWIAKDSPSGLGTIEIAPENETMMADIIDKVKDGISSMANSEKVDAIRGIKISLSSCEGAEDLNEITGAAIESEVVGVVWQDITRVGVSLDLSWDREGRVWIAES